MDTVFEKKFQKPTSSDEVLLPNYDDKDGVTFRVAKIDGDGNLVDLDITRGEQKKRTSKKKATTKKASAKKASAKKASAKKRATKKKASKKIEISDSSVSESSSSASSFDITSDSDESDLEFDKYIKKWHRKNSKQFVMPYSLVVPEGGIVDSLGFANQVSTNLDAGTQTMHDVGTSMSVGVDAMAGGAYPSTLNLPLSVTHKSLVDPLLAKHLMGSTMYDKTIHDLGLSGAYKQPHLSNQSLLKHFGRDPDVLSKLKITVPQSASIFHPSVAMRASVNAKQIPRQKRPKYQDYVTQELAKDQGLKSKGINIVDKRKHFAEDKLAELLKGQTLEFVDTYDGFPKKADDMHVTQSHLNPMRLPGPVQPREVKY